MPKKEKEITPEMLPILIAQVSEALFLDEVGPKVASKRKGRPTKQHMKAILALIRKLLDYIEEQMEEREITGPQLGALLRALDYIALMVRRDVKYRKLEAQLDDIL